MRYLIIGGSGSLGHELISKIGDEPITVLSRGELKQKKLKDKFPKIKCVIGDVKDRQSLKYHFRNVDVCINLAALKHVDIAENNIEECIKTNLLGVINVAKCCISSGVKTCIFTSTDKAVLPVNAYGMSKGLAEKYLMSLNNSGLNTNFVVYRWGNVLGSRGSVVHEFKKTLLKDKTINITHKDMTRFWISLSDVADYILSTYYLPFGKVKIPLMKSSKVLDLAKAVAKYLDIKDYKINKCGIRDGEKIHETLATSHDGCTRSDTARKFTEAELIDLLKEII